MMKSQSLAIVIWRAPLATLVVRAQFGAFISATLVRSRPVVWYLSKDAKTMKWRKHLGIGSSWALQGGRHDHDVPGTEKLIS
jgi:hypothetical protein